MLKFDNAARAAKDANLRIWPGMAVALSLFIFAIGGSAGTPAQSNSLSPLEAELQNAASSVNLSEAELQLRADLDAQLTDTLEAANEVSGFGGSWLTWSPFRLNIAVTEHFHAEISEIVAQNGLEQYTTLVVVENSLIELEQQQADIREALEYAGVQAMDSSVIVETNGIEMYAGSTATAMAGIEALEERGIAEDVQVVLDEPSEPTTIGGGNLLNGCSSSFMVKSTTTSAFGVLGAGHNGCNASTVYLSGSIPTAVTGASTSGYRDSAVQRLLGGSVSNEIYIDVSPFYKSITSGRSWAALNVGDVVCKQARTTGYDCGQIISKNYAPTYVPNGSRFTIVDTNCDNGDSGGSWFVGQAAVGVQSGKKGITGDCIFGSISYAIPGGYVLVTD